MSGSARKGGDDRTMRPWIPPAVVVFAKHLYISYAGHGIACTRLPEENYYLLL